MPTVPDAPVAISAVVAETSLGYDGGRGGDQPTDCTSTIDIASTRHRCSSQAGITQTTRTPHAELTVRFPPFQLYDFAVIRS